MSTSVKRPISFNVTLVLNDGRQFILSDVKWFNSRLYSNGPLSWFILIFYDGTEIDVLFSKIDRFNISVLYDVDVIPFDIADCDYGVREFADYISCDF